ncbi:MULTISPECIES: Sec-independent protein translocase subunit TatA/TatB [Natrialbaceae]|uniref:Sec-independent protein translocase subunit TatA/TatB n=1 Tax=Natrialbaceae TaxID=1644061 RepID=UPI00207CDDD6|nr:twin-arginine translocase TatA/TatE family subunit [Natronococcus sp. CG52]
MSSTVPLFMMPGGPELLIIFFIAVLLFGSAKLPGLARAAGESMGEFQKGRVQVERELDEMRTASKLDSDPDPETEPEAERAAD